jgi:hypothetical protein
VTFLNDVVDSATSIVVGAIIFDPSNSSIVGNNTFSIFCDIKFVVIQSMNLQ